MTSDSESTSCRLTTFETNELMEIATKITPVKVTLLLKFYATYNGYTRVT